MNSRKQGSREIMRLTGESWLLSSDRVRFESRTFRRAANAPLISCFAPENQWGAV